MMTVMKILTKTHHGENVQAMMEGAMIPPKQIYVAKAMVNYSFKIRKLEKYW